MRLPATDFDQFIRHSNEFKFPVAAFHHAHEAWLVPELLKKTYGGTPSIAIFSRNANYKLEAYQGTQYAGAILESYNITPLYKSDHPVTDSRRVLSQAAQAHHFGLSAAAALNAVTSKAAEALGLSHRIGYVREGWDADLVLWNTNPLRLGATPVQVLIDGVVQLHKPSTPAPTFGKDAAPAPPPPRSGNYTAEISQMKREGVKSITFDVDPAPLPRKLVHSASFHNVSKVYMRDTGAATGIKVLEIPSSDTSQETSTVLISDGRISCVGTATSCPSSAANSINLNGGVMLPGLTAFQAAASYSGTLGLGDIASEGSASKGQLLKRGVDGGDVHAAAARSSRPDSTVPRAADGLQFGSRDLANAHASGVTSAVVFPVTKATGEQLPAGLSVQFDTGAKSVAESEAIRQAEVALHFSFTHSSKGAFNSAESPTFRH